MAHISHSRAFVFVVANIFLLLWQIRPISFLFFLLHHVESLPAVFLAFTKTDMIPLQKPQQETVWGAEDRHKA